MRTRLTLRSVIATLTLAGGLAACGTEPVAPQLEGLTRIDDAARAAEQSFGVPADLTLAVAYAETRWQLPTGEEHVDAARGPDVGSAHAPSLVGIGGLRPWRPSASLAAAALGVDEARIATEPVVGIAAASAELRRLAVLRYGHDALPSVDDVTAWYEVVADYGGVEGAGARASYIADVYLLLEHGVDDVAAGGERVVIAARPILLPDLVLPASAAIGAEYPGALWSSASSENYTNGRTGGSINYIVIHTMQGSYSGSISWFRNPAASASAHYNLRSSDGQITQMVSEGDTAWHAGNWTYNQRSIGIEHEGYVADPGRWYTEAMYVSSARLTRHLCDKYGIPKDRAHIIGHVEVPTATHTDPGGGWDWAHYMDLVRGVPAGPAYDASFVAKDHPAEMTSGDRAVAWIDMRNTGSATWAIGGTFVGTTAPRDHAGAFFDAENWTNDHRASGADHSDYGPGATGRFTFMITAPEVAADTTITDTFGLVQEGVTWFGPEDITLSVRVHPRVVAPPPEPPPPAVVEVDAGPPPPAVVPEEDAGTPPEFVVDAGRSAHAADAGLGAARAPFAGGMHGGCSAPGGRSTGGVGWLALALAGLVVAARSRGARRTSVGRGLVPRRAVTLRLFAALCVTWVSGCGLEQGGVEPALGAVQALGEVAGVVSDTISAQPIAGAQVRVVGREDVAITDADGRYALAAPAGTVALSVLDERHLAFERLAVVVRDGETTAGDIALFPSAPSDAEVDRHLARLQAARVRRDDPSDPALRPEARAMLLGERPFPTLDALGGGTTNGDVGGARAALGAPPATIRIWRRSIDGASASCSGRIDVIPFESYVKGVLPHEWISSWRAESLRAGSLAVRTYSWRWINAGGKYDCADLDDTTNSQVYRDDRLAVTTAAVDATRGQGIVSGTSLVSGEYSAENGSPTALGVTDALCAGRTLAGHGRGMCQWGSQRWALDGKAHEWIATHYYPGSAIAGGEPPAPAYDATFVGKDFPREMTAGDRATAYIELRNTGTAEWDVANTRVGTTGPRDHASALFDRENWINDHRASGADHSGYTTGTTGRFTFMITAPEVSADTVISETFGLVQEGVTWFGPGDIGFSITVHPRAAPPVTPPPVTPPPGPTDLDGDGSPAGTDCDDNDAMRAPGAEEVCGNSRDEDCDGVDALCPAYVPDSGVATGSVSAADAGPAGTDSRPRASDVDGCSVARPTSAGRSGACLIAMMSVLALLGARRRR